jgi:superfamily II helicase
MTGKKGSSPESIVREIKRQTRRKFTAEEKIRIVLEGLRGEAGITDLCRMCFVKGKYPKKSSQNTHEPAGTFS